MERLEISRERSRSTLCKGTIQNETVCVLLSLPIYLGVVVNPVDWLGIQPACDKNIVVESLLKHQFCRNLEGLTENLNADEPGSRQ